MILGLNSLFPFIQIARKDLISRKVGILLWKTTITLSNIQIFMMILGIKSPFSFIWTMRKKSRKVGNKPSMINSQHFVSEKFWINTSIMKPWLGIFWFIKVSHSNFCDDSQMKLSFSPHLICTVRKDCSRRREGNFVRKITITMSVINTIIIHLLFVLFCSLTVSNSNFLVDS